MTEHDSVTVWVANDEVILVSRPDLMALRAFDLVTFDHRPPKPYRFVTFAGVTMREVAAFLAEVSPRDYASRVAGMEASRDESVARTPDGRVDIAAEMRKLPPNGGVTP